MASDVTASDMTASPPVDPPEARTPLVVWAVPAVLTFGLCLPATVHAVLWQDELATLSAVSRSIPDLIRLLIHRDAVHGLYYLLVHLATILPGATPVTVRLPAALGAAVWSALVAVLGARLAGRRAGLLAGLLLAVLPAVSRFGAEARPYTLAAAAATGCTLAFVLARERGGRRAWAWYAATAVLTGYLQLTAVLVVGAHGLAVLYLWRGGDRRLLRAWAVSTGLAVVPLLPLVALAALQSSELGNIPGPTWRSAVALPFAAFFAPTAGALVVGLAWPALARRDVRAVLLGAFALLPPVVVLVVSLHTSLMRPRYLLFTLAGWALAAALALSPGQVGRPRDELSGARSAGVGTGTPGQGRRAALAAFLAVALLSLPQQLDQISTTRNGQPDYRTMAAVLAPLTRPGDAMVFPQAHGIRFRIGLNAYLPAERRPADVLASATPADAAALDSRPCDPAQCLGTPPRLWIGCVGPCSDPLGSITADQRRVIAERGYRTARRLTVPGGAISLLLITAEH